MEAARATSFTTTLQKLMGAVTDTMYMFYCLLNKQLTYISLRLVVEIAVNSVDSGEPEFIWHDKKGWNHWSRAPFSRYSLLIYIQLLMKWDDNGYLRCYTWRLLPPTVLQVTVWGTVPRDRPLCVRLTAESLPVSLANEWTFNDLRGPFNWVENVQVCRAQLHLS